MSVYSNKRVLVTGGTGYIGSALAAKLSAESAHVAILSRSFLNVEWLEQEAYKHIERIEGSVLDVSLLESLVGRFDVIFNLAGNAKHIRSNAAPFDDLDINCRAPLILLEACRTQNPHAKIVFSSSRLVYGKMLINPISEDHPVNPTGFYGIHKRAAESYHDFYFRVHGIPTTVLRLTNVYGENKLGVTTGSIPDLFMQKALQNGCLTIHDNGAQLRDYIHLDDAINALLMAGASEKTAGGVYNVGSGISVPFKRMAECIVSIAGSGTIEYTARPKEYEFDESGDFVMDISRFSNATVWKPMISLENGLRQMYEFYKLHRDA